MLVQLDDLGGYFEQRLNYKFTINTIYCLLIFSLRLTIRLTIRPIKVERYVCEDVKRHLNC